MCDKEKYVVWGAGGYFTNNWWRLSDKLEIEFICDKDEKKWGRYYTEKHLLCRSPEALKLCENIVVIIAVRERKYTEEIIAELKNYPVSYVHINAIIRESCREKELLQIAAYDQKYPSAPQEFNESIKKFISISVPVRICNLSCRYCYIGHRGDFANDDAVFPSPEFIRRALSRKRAGGTALLNFCGVGETLLCRELFEIIAALLKEGHYISIISNALLTRELQKYIGLEEALRARLFFKCSFHYRELKRKNLLDKFARNVQMLRDSGISISVELVPEDDIEDAIPEIMEYSLRNFGALPHVTVPRDERKEDCAILSNHSEEEFRKIWGQFHSQMFDMKMQMRSHIHKFCHAGEYSLLVSLDTGEAQACPFEKSFTNIYEDITKPLKEMPVGNACRSPYCINSHAYLALGMIEDIHPVRYLEVRDRQSDRWEHWVCGRMADIFQQRICENVKGGRNGT